LSLELNIGESLEKKYPWTRKRVSSAYSIDKIVRMKYGRLKALKSTHYDMEIASREVVFMMRRGNDDSNISIIS
jgi:hypothetical protein